MIIQWNLSGILKANEAVERLRYSKINNQVSFHTEAALKNLENALWAESAGYIADRYYEEKEALAANK